MIVSASRRTDIPAFYSEWFINRIKAGYCTVPNPFNRNQVSVVSLALPDVDAIVFWTRNPRPLMSHLNELDQRGYRYYFQYTILGYPKEIDPSSPPLDSAIDTFIKISKQVSSARVIWRYDPIFLSLHTDFAYHTKQIREIAARLQGHTQRLVISVVDDYPKTASRMKMLEAKGHSAIKVEIESLGAFMRDIAQIATEHELEIYSCAEELDLTPFGIRPGKCIDNQYISRVFGISVTSRKDASQRPACGCVTSRDIGSYDTCLFGCQYCYATSSFARARVNHEQHNPLSPSLLGWHDVKQPNTAPFQSSLWDNNDSK